MNNTRLLAALAVFTCTLGSAALAHHSAQAYYQMDKRVEMTGKVTEFRMGNPHARIYFDVKNADGSTTQWLAEGGSRTVLLRTGWKGDEVKVGDVVKVQGNPSRDDKKIVHMINVILPDGRSLYAEDTNPEGVNELLERRRKRN